MTKKRKFAKIKWKNLIPNPRPYTKVNQNDVERLVRNWDDEKVGIPVVNSLLNGKLRLLDANHRHAAAMLLGKGEEEVMCEIHFDLTPEQEADLIISLQRNRRSYRLSDLIYLEAQTGDNDSIRILTILDEMGVPLSDRGSGSQSKVKGPTVGPCKSIIKTSGGYTLQTVLDIVNNINPVWNEDGAQYHQALLKGLALMVNRTEGDIDVDRLKRKLARTSPGLLIGYGTSSFHGYKMQGKKRSLAQCVNEKILEVYNARGSTSILAF